MLKFIVNFLKSYLLPIVKEAAAQAVVNQINDVVYGPNKVRPIRSGYYNQYGRRPSAVPDEEN